MIDTETRARIRHLFYVEHWKVGTIARELMFHPDTVSNALETDRFNNTQTLRPRVRIDSLKIKLLSDRCLIQNPTS